MYRLEGWRFTLLQTGVESSNLVSTGAATQNCCHLHSPAEMTELCRPYLLSVLQGNRIVICGVDEDAHFVNDPSRGPAKATMSEERTSAESHGN